MIKGVFPKKKPKKYAAMSLITISDAGRRNLHQYPTMLDPTTKTVAKKKKLNNAILIGSEKQLILKVNSIRLREDVGGSSSHEEEIVTHPKKKNLNAINLKQNFQTVLLIKKKN